MELTDKEIDAILSKSIDDKRFFCQLIILRETGLRLQAMVNLQIKNIFKENLTDFNDICYIYEKGNKKRDFI